MKIRCFNSFLVIPFVLSISSCANSNEFDSFMIRDKQIVSDLNNFQCFNRHIKPGENRKNCFKSLYTGKDYFFNGGFFQEMNSERIYKPVLLDFNPKIDNFYVCYIPSALKKKCEEYLLNKYDQDFDAPSMRYVSSEECVSGLEFAAAQKLKILNKCKWYCFQNVSEIEALLPLKDNIGIVLFSKKVRIQKDLLNNAEINKNVNLYGRIVFSRNTLDMYQKIYNEYPDSVYIDEHLVFQLEGQYLSTSNLTDIFANNTIYSPSLYVSGHIPYFLKRNYDSSYFLDYQTKEFLKNEFQNLYEDYSLDSNDKIEENDFYTILKTTRL